MTKTTFSTLTLEDINAIKAFAADYGRTWKSELSNKYWYNARLWRDSTGSTVQGSILHGLRNSHGPEWLDTFSLKGL